MTYRGDILGRFDPYFYQPEFTKLEAHVRRLTSQKLRDFIVRIAGGSTPDIKRHDEYYTDAHNGISFIRVQNLSPEGLQLDDCKYVTFNTHNGLLKRSQVSGGDLLVKITGVGRMAVSSVVHYGFEGNINQHIAAIKTKNYQTSEVLATFLNSDVGEKLAARRSTGGTRPALDYSALKSIPIIYNPQIVEIMQSAYAQKKQKEQEADALLDSIDDYVLAELGIEMPAVEEKKCFVVYANERTGRRVDPLYLKNISHFRSIKTPYSLTPLGKLLIDKPEYGANERAINGNPETDVRYIRITDIDDYGNLLNDDWKTAGAIHPKYWLRENDVLFARSGSAGRAFIYKSQLGRAIFAGYLIRFKFDSAKVNPSFVFYYTLTKMYKLWVQSIQRTAVQANINAKEFQSLRIPLAPLDVQNRIVEEANKRLSHAAQLRQEADAIVKEAKREVERVMLEGVSG